MTTATTQLPEDIPPELNRWNWGAFLLHWIWGVGNGVYIALLMFVPFVNIVMMFVLGAKGSAWAWRRGGWTSVEHFRRVQRLWAIWGVVIWLGFIGLFAAIFGGVFYFMAHSEPYTLVTAKLQASAEVTEALGSPLSFGFPSGNVSVDGGEGSASMNFTVTGPKGSGHASFTAKKFGSWKIETLRVLPEGSDKMIQVIGAGGAFYVPLFPATRRLRPGFG